MHFNEFNDKETVKTIVFQELKENGIKHKQKKIYRQTDKACPKELFHVPLQNLKASKISLSCGVQVKIPQCLHRICLLIEEDIAVEGLFRKAGSNLRQRKIKEILNTHGKLDPGEHHVIDIANILKLFLRELPEPLIPHAFHDAFLTSLVKDDRDTLILTICLLLPPAHLDALMYVMELLQKVVLNSDMNKMTAYNLAITITPSIMPVDESVQIAHTHRIAHHVKVVQTLIENADKIGVLPECVVDRLPVLVRKVPLDTSGNFRRRKNRSNSLTNMFSGLRKIVSSKPDPEIITPDVIPTPIIIDKSLKRKVTDSVGLSSKKKRDIINKLPAKELLPDTPCKRITTVSQLELKATPLSNDSTSYLKRSYLQLTSSKSKNKRNSLDVESTGEKEPKMSALNRLERRWSIVSSSSIWGRRRKSGANFPRIDSNNSDLDTQVDIMNLDDDVFGLNDNITEESGQISQKTSLGCTVDFESPESLVNVKSRNKMTSLVKTKAINENDSPSGEYVVLKQTPQDHVIEKLPPAEFMRIPKSEYEEIKNRVTAIEKRLSQELENFSPIAPLSVEQVQQKYALVCEESNAIHNQNNSSAERLSKRLTQELRIRRRSADGSSPFRSPSARKIGTIRRRSKDRERKSSVQVKRTQSCNVATSLRRQRLEPIVVTPMKVMGDEVPLMIGRNRLKRGQPNTLHSGLSKVSPCKNVNSNGVVNESPKINVASRNKTMSPQTSNRNWKNAVEYLKDTNRTPKIHGRASVAQLRVDNAGGVLAKAKLFDNKPVTLKTTIARSSSSVESPNKSIIITRSNSQRTPTNMDIVNYSESLNKRSQRMREKENNVGFDVVVRPQKGGKNVTPTMKRAFNSAKTPCSLRKLQLHAVDAKSKTPMKATHLMGRGSERLLRRSPRLMLKDINGNQL